MTLNFSQQPRNYALGKIGGRIENYDDYFMTFFAFDGLAIYKLINPEAIEGDPKDWAPLVASFTDQYYADQIKKFVEMLNEEQFEEVWFADNGFGVYYNVDELELDELIKYKQLRDKWDGMTEKARMQNVLNIACLAFEQFK